MNVKINIDSTQKILLKRNLNENGKAQMFFTDEVKRLSDPYIPFDDGGLKTQIDVQPDKIIYKSPYAKKQFYENKGFGKQGTSNGGMRGKQWINRMWADSGSEIVESVSKFVGGKSK